MVSPENGSLVGDWRAFGFWTLASSSERVYHSYMYCKLIELELLGSRIRQFCAAGALELDYIIPVLGSRWPLCVTIHRRRGVEYLSLAT